MYVTAGFVHIIPVQATVMMLAFSPTPHETIVGGVGESLVGVALRGVRDDVTNVNRTQQPLRLN